MSVVRFKVLAIAPYGRCLRTAVHPQHDEANDEADDVNHGYDDLDGLQC